MASNAGQQAHDIDRFTWSRDAESLRHVPSWLRDWLEFEANDTYEIGPILEAVRKGWSWPAIETHFRNYSRNQYVEDYKWTGEEPPMKGKTNELQMPGVQDKRPVRVHDVSMGRVPRRKRHRSSLSSRVVVNDGDYYSPY